MRRQLVRLCCAAIVAATAGCEAHHVVQSAPVTGINPYVGDSLIFLGTKMLQPELIFSSPSIPGLAIDPERQRALDEAGDRLAHRSAWGLRYKNTGDLLEIVIHRPGDDKDPEQQMRRVAAAERADALRAKRTVGEDTVEWNDHRREYRQLSRDPKSKDEWWIRCVPAMTPSLAGFVTCYKAHGPTVTQTLARAVAGLTAPGYLEFTNGTAVVVGVPPGAFTTGVVTQAGAPAPPRPTDITIANGRAFNAMVGVVFPVSATTVVNWAAQERANQVAILGGEIAWVLIDTATTDRVNVSVAPDGQRKLDEAEWRGKFQRSLSAALKSYPTMIDSKNAWRDDTASFHYVLQNAAGLYRETVCKGSSVGRENSLVVCVTTLSMRREAFGGMERGLVLTRQGEDPTARTPTEGAQRRREEPSQSPLAQLKEKP